MDTPATQAPAGLPTQLVNETGFALTLLRDPTARPSLIRAAVLKATFALEDDGTWQPAKKQRDLEADTPFMDTLGRSLEWASDLVVYKPRVDVLVHGAFHQPGGRPAPSGRATLEFGTTLRKELAFFGPRRAARRAKDGDWVVSLPEPMTTVPLRWELALGGLDDAANPLGRGRTPDAQGVLDMPQIEYPALPVRTPQDRSPPANFAAVPPGFHDRQRKWGTRDRQWLWFRAPLPPADYDPSVHNAAPADQQGETYAVGNEALVLHNLHPKHPVLRTVLPGLRPRAGVLRQIAGEGIRAQEMSMHLDTVIALPEEDQLVLTWRGLISLADADEPEPPMLRVELENLADAPEPFAPGLAARMFATWQQQNPPAAAPPEPQATPPEPADIAADMKKARELFAKLNLPPALQAIVDHEPDPQVVFDVMSRHIEQTALALQKKYGAG